jgi:hypothetical protein
VVAAWERVVVISSVIVVVLQSSFRARTPFPPATARAAASVAITMIRAHLSDLVIEVPTLPATPAIVFALSFAFP